jgi:hypothetical protein
MERRDIYYYIRAQLDLADKKEGIYYLNKENNFEYLINPYDYTKYYTIDTNSVIGEVNLYSDFIAPSNTRIAFGGTYGPSELNNNESIDIWSGYDNNPASLTAEQINSGQICYYGAVPLTPAPDSDLGTRKYLALKVSFPEEDKDTSWATRMSGLHSIGKATQVDSEGNVIVGGTYGPANVGTEIKFYNQPGSDDDYSGIYLDIRPSPYSTYNKYSYVCKYNQSGEIIWAAPHGGEAWAELVDLNIDNKTNDIYITGNYGENIPFGTSIQFFSTPSPGSSPVISLTRDSPTEYSGIHVYIAKYNTDGIIQWLNSLRPEWIYVLPNYLSCSSINTDSNGNVITTGTFQSKIYYRDKEESTIFSMNSTNYAGYIFKISSDGDLLWGTKIGDNNTGIQCALFGATGGIFILGNYDNNYPVVFYNQPGGPGDAAITLGGIGSCCYISRYNTIGEARWAAKITNDNYARGNYVVTDYINRLIIGGDYNGNTNLRFYNRLDIENLTLPFEDSNYSHSFIVKYNSTGYPIWATRLTCRIPSGINLTSVDRDTANNIYAVGNFTSPVYIYNNGDTLYDVIGYSAGTNSFIVKYDTNGMCQWVTKIYGSSSNLRAISVNEEGYIYITGSYNSNPLYIYFNQGGIITEETLPFGGDTSSYLIKFVPTLIFGDKISEGVVNVTMKVYPKYAN